VFVALLSILTEIETETEIEITKEIEIAIEKTVGIRETVIAIEIVNAEIEIGIPGIHATAIPIEIVNVEIVIEKEILEIPVLNAIFVTEILVIRTLKTEILAIIEITVIEIETEIPEILAIAKEIVPEKAGTVEITVTEKKNAIAAPHLRTPPKTAIHLPPLQIPLQIPKTANAAVHPVQSRRIKEPNEKQKRNNLTTTSKKYKSTSKTMVISLIIEMPPHPHILRIASKAIVSA